MYFPTGATGAEAFAAYAFCSPDRPVPGCTPTAGTAKPITKECLARFKDFQTQLNRVAVGVGLAPVCIDGWIGPESTRTIKAIPDGIKQQSQLPPSKRYELREFLSGLVSAGLKDLGLNAATYTVMLRNVADELGVAASVAGRGCKSPGVYTPAKVAPAPAPAPERGGAGPAVPAETAAPPPATPALGIKFSDPLVLAALGVVGLLLFTGKKGGKKAGARKRGRKGARTSRRRTTRARRRAR